MAVPVLGPLAVAWWHKRRCKHKHVKGHKEDDHVSTL